MKNKILVTGGFGFIGSNFIKSLDRRFTGDVHVIDKMTYAANFANLDGEYDTLNIVHHEHDISNHAACMEIFNKYEFEAIFHFAAESHVDNSIHGPLIFTDTNVVGTHTLLEAWRRNKSKGRFIHISTDEVYGHLGEHDDPFTEETPLAPRSPYSASKASSDLIVKAYHATYGSDVTITRCCNNYGPNQHIEKLIPKTITNILKGEKVPIYGTGKNIREWIYVLDHAEAIWSVYKQGVPGDVYNIGSGHEMTNIDLVNIICKELDVDPSSVLEFVEDRKGHDFRYALDSSKIKNELNWKPKYGFEEYIKKTIKHYQNTTA